MQFADQPDVYNKFLDIMKDFKSQTYVRCLAPGSATELVTNFGLLS